MLTGRVSGPLLAAALSLVLAACSGASDAPAPQVVPMRVTDRGFEPSRVALEAGRPARLEITRTTNDTCAREIVIDEFEIDTPLPLDTLVAVEFTPTAPGELRYGCAMGKMIGGVLVIE